MGCPGDITAMTGIFLNAHMKNEALIHLPGKGAGRCKHPLLPRDRIHERHLFGKQLERAVPIIFLFREKPGVASVVDNGAAHGTQVKAELVLFTGFGEKPETGSVVPGFQEFHPGYGIGVTRYDPVPEPGLAPDNTVFHAVRNGSTGFGPEGHGFIGLFDLPVHEEALEEPPGGRPDGKKNKACGFPVNAVDWNKVGVTGLLFQAVQQGLVNIGAGGNHRQEMGLARHKKVVVQEKDRLLERNHQLNLNLSIIMNPGPGKVRGLQGDRAAIPGGDKAFANPACPDLPADAGESVVKEIQDSGKALGILPGKGDRGCRG